MLIIPAIDIKGGKCVRLFKGQFDKETVFSNDPVAMAKQFEAEGAKWLHVIDLDGAEKGKVVNFEIIKKIKKQTKLKLEAGGGIRDIDTLQKLLDLKVDDIILGTMAIKNPYMTAYIKDKEKMIICVDAKGNKVMIDGWQAKTNITINELIKTFINQGITEFEYTDTERDGTLNSPNFRQVKKIRKEFPKIRLGVAGGIATVKDLIKLKELKVDSVIIGKSLYTNKELREYVSQKNYTLS